MKKLIFAMSENDVARFMSDSRDVKAAALKMTSKEMHEAFAELKSVCKAHYESGEDVPENEVDALYNMIGSTAHIPVEGLLTPKASPCDLFSGESVTEYGFIQNALISADADPEVKEIVLDFESGGGYVSGVDETAQVIASTIKPVTAVVHSMCASAAYWLASQCDRIIATSPASQIGSIGVACETDDNRAQLEKEGVVHRVFTSSNAPDKRPDLATEEGQSVIQKELDDLAKVFADRIASGRNTTRENVFNNYGRGAVLIAEDAKGRGMIDEILGQVTGLQNTSTVGGDNENAVISAENKSEGHNMTIEEIKAQHPEVEEALKAEFENGVKAERNRRDALSKYRGINADGDNAVEEAIASGVSVEDAMSTINAAVLKGKADPQTENAPAISTAENDDSAAYGTEISAEDAEWYKQHGMSADDVAKYVG